MAQYIALRCNKGRAYKWGERIVKPVKIGRSKTALLGLVCAAYGILEISSGIGTAAAAESDQAERKLAVEEVVVTARRRDESLKDAPVALNVFSSDEIERLALNDLDQLSTQVPGLNIVTSGPSGAASIYLRGVGTSAGSTGFSTAVGIVIDDQYFSRARWIQPGMFDIKQVQVLRGPQALYFGKNNTAGLIMLETQDPGDELEGYIRAGYETESEEMAVEGAVSIPLTDSLAVRLAAKTSDMDGWMKNNAGPGVDPLGFALPGASYKILPQEKETIARVTVRWTPNDELEAVFKATVNDQHNGGVIANTQLVECFGPGGTPQNSIGGIPEPYADCDLNFTTAMGGFNEEFLAEEGPEFIKAAGPRGAQTADWKSSMMTLKLDYTLEDVTLSSVTGYQKFDTEDIGSFTFDSSGSLPSYQTNDYKAFSQEVRFATTFDKPLNFMAGFLYAHDDLDYRTTSRIAIFQPSSNGRRFSWDRPSTTQYDTWSVFGEVVWTPIDDLEISAGARYMNEEMDAGMSLTYVHDIFHAIGYLNEEPFSLTEKFTNVSPQVTVSWRATDNVTLYGAYKEGFKSGGFDSSNTLTANTTGEDLLFDGETAQGFEVGAKSVLLDSKLSLNGTIYYYDFDDLQVQTFDPAVIAFLTRNAAKSNTKGVEADFQWLATDRLSLRGALAYNKAEYDKFITSCYPGQSQEAGCNLNALGEPISSPAERAIQRDVGGSPLAFAPEWFGKLGATYDLGLGRSWRTDLNVDLTVSDEYQIGEIYTQDSYVTYDASIRIYDVRDRWEFSLIGRNLSNEPIVVGAGGRPLTGGASGLPAGNPLLLRADTYAAIQRGRQVWLQATYRFQQ